MSLQHESTRKSIGWSIGDIKIAPYDITFTLNQLVEPEVGWYLLNGAVLSESAYPILYSRFSGLFNTGGEGAGNFRLPDHTEGAFPITKGLTNFTSYAGSGGEINHVLTVSEVAAHTHPNTLSLTAHAHSHSGSTYVATAVTHTHTYSLDSLSGGYPAGSTSQVAATTTGNTGSGGAAHTHTVTVSGGHTSNQTETYTKTAGSLGNTGGTIMTVSMGTGDTTITIADPTGFPGVDDYVIAVDSEQMLVTAGQGGTVWSVTRGYNGTSVAAHTTPANVIMAHNNMMPYIVIGGILVRHD